MRMQAVIIVGISVCICLTTFVMKGLYSSSKAINEPLFYKTVQVIIGICCVFTVSFLTVALIRCSRMKYKNRQPGKTPSTPRELLDRMMPHYTPLQFSILSMLALMVGFALICSTVKCVFFTP
jgi:hypothetical protein